MKKLPTLADLGFIKLFEDRILVKLEDGDQKSKGGIILIQKDGEEKQKIGVVIGTGPGERDLETGKLIRAVEVKRNDRVMFGKYEGSELSLQGEAYYIIRQLGIIGQMAPLPEEKIADSEHINQQY